MTASVIKLKLGRPYQMPKKRFDALLRQQGREADKARNAAMMHWYRWRKDHPEWTPGAPYDAPQAKIKRKPKEGAKPPKDSPIGPRLFLSRELYQAARQAAPTLAGSLASACVQDVIQRLRAKTPYNHDGEARFVWQAILGHETSVPTWRSGVIPVMRNTSSFGYCGQVTRASNDAERAAEHEAVLQFQLLSNVSGYRVRSPSVRLEVGDMSRGHRRLLRRIAAGQVRMADSSIVETKGKWFLALCYAVDPIDHGLDAERTITLLPALPEDRWPFVLRFGEDGTWKVGKAKPMVAEYQRIVARRRAIRYRYADGCGKGHGKKRWYKSLRPMGRAVKDLQDRFEKQLVADIVQYAIRQGFGKLSYREPTMPVRQNSWFEGQGKVPFGWVEFEARLKFKCEQHGIEYSKQRIGMGEWGPRKEKNAG